MLQNCPPFGFFWAKPVLTQTGYNEFRILRIPDIELLVFKTGVFSELCNFYFNLFLSPTWADHGLFFRNVN